MKKLLIKPGRVTQQGASTLLFSVALLTLTTMLTVFAANHSSMQSKSISNVARSAEAYEAAQAGLQFGVNYLTSNSSTILANPSGGYIQAYSSNDTSNVTLSNGTSFTIAYTNPEQDNFELIRVSSTGNSADGSATKTLSVLVQGSGGGGITSSADRPLIAKGNGQFTGNSTITNTYNDNTVQLGGTLNFTGNGKTVISSGTSSNGSNLGSDVTENDASLNSATDEAFFTSMFGADSSTVESSADIYLTSGSNKNYRNDLDDVVGQTIWIEQTGGTAQFTGNTTIGSATEPVVLIINGQAQFTGNTKIYGYVFIMGATSSVQFTGNSKIFGAVGSTNNVNATGNTRISYDPAILDGVPAGTGAGTLTFAKVPGSWRDF